MLGKWTFLLAKLSVFFSRTIPAARCWRSNNLTRFPGFDFYYCTIINWIYNFLWLNHAVLKHLFLWNYSEWCVLIKHNTLNYGELIVAFSVSPRESNCPLCPPWICITVWVRFLIMSNCNPSFVFILLRSR